MLYCFHFYLRRTHSMNFICEYNITNQKNRIKIFKRNENKFIYEIAQPDNIIHIINNIII